MHYENWLLQKPRVVITDADNTISMRYSGSKAEYLQPDASILTEIARGELRIDFSINEEGHRVIRQNIQTALFTLLRPEGSVSVEGTALATLPAICIANQDGGDRVDDVKKKIGALILTIMSLNGSEAATAARAEFLKAFSAYFNSAEFMQATLANAPYLKVLELIQTFCTAANMNINELAEKANKASFWHHQQMLYYAQPEIRGLDMGHLVSLQLKVKTHCTPTLFIAECCTLSCPTELSLSSLEQGKCKYPIKLVEGDIEVGLLGQGALSINYQYKKGSSIVASLLLKYLVKACNAKGTLAGQDTIDLLNNIKELLTSVRASCENYNSQTNYMDFYKELASTTMQLQYIPQAIVPIKPPAPSFDIATRATKDDDIVNQDSWTKCKELLGSQICFLLRMEKSYSNIAAVPAEASPPPPTHSRQGSSPSSIKGFLGQFFGKSTSPVPTILSVNPRLESLVQIERALQRIVANRVEQPQNTQEALAAVQVLFGKTIAVLIQMQGDSKENAALHEILTNNISHLQEIQQHMSGYSFSALQQIISSAITLTKDIVAELPSPSPVVQQPRTPSPAPR